MKQKLVKKIKKVLRRPLISISVLAGLFFLVGAQIANAQGDPVIAAIIGLLGGPKNIWSGIGSGFGVILLTLTGKILWVAGLLLNFVVTEIVIGMGAFVKSIGAIDIAWEVIRDFANMIFIFVLLFISISTILGISKYGARQLLVKVVLAALLVNFSLFFTKVIIDTSNVITAGFYTGIVGISSDQIVVTGTSEENEGHLVGSAVGGLSGAFMQPLLLTTIFNASPVLGPEGVAVDEALAPNSIFTISLAGSLFILITAFIFFAGAILLTIRFIVLIVLMVLSPLAFVSIILPSMSQFWNKWWSTLLNQSFFAPIYMAMMFVVAVIVNNNGFRDAIFRDPQAATATFSGLFIGQGGMIPVVLNFAIISGLMIAALIVSKNLGAQGAKVATSLAGKATFGVAGFAGRQTLGRAGLLLSQSGFANQLAQRGGVSGLVGKGLVGTGEQFSKRSFDLRSALNTVGADVGKPGGKGGFKKSKEEAIKKYTTYGERAATALGQTEAERKIREEARERFVQERTSGLRSQLASAREKEEGATGFTKQLATSERIRIERKLAEEEAKAQQEYIGTIPQRLLGRSPSQESLEKQLQDSARALTFEQTRIAKTVQEAQKKLSDLEKKGASATEIQKAESDLAKAKAAQTEEINKQVSAGQDGEALESAMGRYIEALDNVADAGKKTGAAIGQAKQFYGERYASATTYGIPSDVRREAAKKLRSQKGAKDKLLDTIKESVKKGDLSGEDLGVETTSGGDDSSSETPPAEPGGETKQS